MAAVVGEPDSGSAGQPETTAQAVYWQQVNDQWVQSEQTKTLIRDGAILGGLLLLLTLLR